jgi:uncharacterized damage-inducible protein DinB
MASVPSYARYLADREPLAVMRENLGRLGALTAGWEDAQYERPWAEGKWTGRQVLLHLAHTELALGNRARMALSTPNYEAQRFDQDRWIDRETAITGREALAALTALIRMNLRLFEVLSPADRATPMSHPDYGSITVDWIIHLLAGHQLHHFEQLAKVPARL